MAEGYPSTPIIFTPPRPPAIGSASLRLSPELYEVRPPCIKWLRIVPKLRTECNAELCGVGVIRGSAMSQPRPLILRYARSRGLHKCERQSPSTSNHKISPSNIPSPNPNNLPLPLPCPTRQTPPPAPATHP